MINNYSASTDTLELINSFSNQTNVSIVYETSMASESISTLNILNFNVSSFEETRMVPNNTPEMVDYINELENLPSKRKPNKWITSCKICTMLTVFSFIILMACLVILLCIESSRRKERKVQIDRLIEENEKCKGIISCFFNIFDN